MHDGEKDLEKWKEEIKKNEIQDEQLENAILQGFRRAKDTNIKRRFRRRGVWSAIVAAVLLLTFITSIRVSPVFANAIGSIPGMSGFVEMIQSNKGLQLAIENDHFQAVGVSEETAGMKVTLEGIITDESTMLAFSTIETKDYPSQYQTTYRILNLQGEVISQSKYTSASFQYTNNLAVSTNEAEFEIDGEIPHGNLLLEYEIREKHDGEVKETFQIPFQNNLKPIKKEQYIINGTVVVEGQKIHIRSVTIGSLKTAVEVEFDEGNTKKIFGFEDLTLVDDKGEVWSSINNGITGRGTDDPNVTIYYLQSNYFKESDHLTLKFKKLMAMDKQEAFVMIDTKKKEIIQQPKEMRFSNLTVNGTYINLEMKGEEGYHHDPFSTMYDADGKEIRLSGTFSNIGDEEIRVGFELSDEQYKNPLTLPLSYYPSYIKGDVTIKIK